jgi:hypothetical protein
MTSTELGLSWNVGQPVEKLIAKKSADKDKVLNQSLPALRRRGMVRKARLIAIAFFSLIIGGSIQACSVGMALSGSEAPDLSAIKVGATRGEVELHLGTPLQSDTLADGNRADVYEYEIGNEPDTARAMGHGVMDVLTLGIWEVIGTPIEASQGKKYRCTIIYGPDDRVVAIRAGPKR